MQKVSIIGLGWLGLPLAKRLMASGVSVVGSSSQLASCQRLQDQGLDCHHWHSQAMARLPSALCTDTVILTLPPSRCPDYLRVLANLLQQLVQAGCQRLIYIGSTAIYGVSAIGDESQPTKTDSPRGERMAEAEALVMNSGIPDWCLIRAAGLIGPQRHPGDFIAGRDGGDGLAPVNLVHGEDVIGIVLAVLQQQAWGQIFNACAPTHPTRREFYRRACQLMGREPPCFSEQPALSKQIDGSKVTRVLGYQYRVSDLLAWLESSSKNEES